MTQTPETTEGYRRRALALIKQVKAELHTDRLNVDQHVDWFSTHHDTWAPSTIRQYRAGLVQLVTDTVGTRKIIAAQGEALAEKLRGHVDKNDHQIAPRALRISPRPKKRKSLSPRIAQRLIKRLSERRTKAAILGQLIVAAGPEIGVRPCEWDGLEVYEGFCLVRNAKNTNNRANGKTRQILIPPQPNAIELLATADEIAATISADIPWKNMQRRVNYCLNRASRDLGLKIPASLSTLRHVAIGRWKCIFGPDEVAALAGHASNATAVRHYGRRRSGRKWPPVLVRPVLPSLSVRDHFRCYEGRLISSNTI